MVLCLAAIALAVLCRIIDFNLWDRLMYHIIKLQSEFNKDAAIKINLLHTNYSTDLFQALLVSSFLYGALHAIGPGHGKSIITGWILTRQRHLKDIALVTMGATLLHAFSAVAIVAAIFYLAGKYLPGMMRTMYLWLNVVSGLMLVMAGAQQLGENYKQYSNRPYKTKRLANHLQSVHPAWIALSIGIVPCPLAAVMFIYCMTSNMVVNGLLLVTAFALGMGLTLFLVAASVWLMKNKAARADNYRVSGFCLKWLNVLSALFFIVLGISIILPNIQKAF